jgi:sterol desaturase/sphingolipid hydroxylase (fatty acid hydroxylase superfamily)
MTAPGQVLAGVLLLPANYYAATLSLWLGHWFSHRRWSPLRAHHVYSHHRVYPPEGPFRSAGFVFAQGRYDSNRAFLPWFALPVAATLILVPPDLRVLSLLELVAATSWVAWIHVQVHLEDSPLDRWAWFARARRRHELHHLRDRNYAVGDHFWDRLWGTFQEPPGPD